MRRINITMARTAAVLLSLLTLPLFAETADLRVSLQAPLTTRPGWGYYTTTSELGRAVEVR